MADPTHHCPECRREWWGPTGHACARCHVKLRRGPAPAAETPRSLPGCGGAMGDGGPGCGMVGCIDCFPPAAPQEAPARDYPIADAETWRLAYGEKCESLDKAEALLAAALREIETLRAALAAARAAPREDEAPRPPKHSCLCGHGHLAGVDGEDGGCPDCDCGDWRAPATETPREKERPAVGAAGLPTTGSLGHNERRTDSQSTTPAPAARAAPREDAPGPKETP